MGLLASSNFLFAVVACVNMAVSKAKVFPVMIVAFFCGTVYRKLAFAASSSNPAPGQRSIHQHCRAVSGASHAVPAFVGAPAVLSSVPARQGVPAHFSVTLQ